ncbi:MAG: methyltransferase domain-containing protein [Clostridiales bacterium]|nr:methyltransferase domain-containing protein [Clostridiales bacterium]
MYLICPVCGGALAGGRAEGADGKAIFAPLRCGSGHCFDVSSKGYVNLLRSGGNHGDSAEMLEARRRFLGGGYYIPLSDAVIGAVGDILPDHCSVLDAGCGEGWYINRLDLAFGRKAGIAAVDVSPKAAAMTAGLFQKSERMRRVFCAAASVNSLPVESGSVDVLLSIFSPLAPDEFSRAVRAGGLVIRAVPTARHLWQLKETLYERPYENDETPRPLPGFEPVSVRRVEYGMTVNGAEDIKALYSMTPYYRKTGSDDERKLLSLDRLDTEAGFIVTAYRRLN